MEKLLRRMFDGYPVFMKQTFQIVEWAIVVVAMDVAAAKLGLPLVQLVARALYILLCFHVGVQSEQLVAWARNGKRPPAIQGIFLPLLAASAFGSAVTYLTIVLGKISLSS